MKLYRIPFLFLLFFLFVPFVALAQKTKIITGQVVQEISENKWSAIVVEVEGRRFGVQTAFFASAGDNMDGVKGFEIVTVGDTSKGKTVQVFYTTVDNTFDYDGVSSWLKAVKIIEVKTPFPINNAVQLKQEVSELRQAILKKIDDDVESTALGFTSSKEILRPLRVAYTFKTVLDTVTGTFGIISDASNVRSLKTSVMGVSSPIEYAGSMLAVHGAYQNGETLAFVFDGNRYSTSVSQMLEAADATQPTFRFDSLRYKNSIKQSLEVGNGTNIIIMPHREPQAVCQTIQPRGAKFVSRASVKGLATLRRYVTVEFQKLENYVATKTYSPQQASELQTLIRSAKRAVIESKSRSTTVNLTAPVSLVSSTCKPIANQVSLGRIADKQIVLQAAYGALDKGLQFEQLMTIKSAGDGIASTTQVFLKGKGGRTQQKILDVTSKMSLAFDVGNLAKDYIFKSQDPKEMIVEKPQEMLLALPEEGTSLLLLTDNLSRIIQQSNKNTVTQPPIATKTLSAPHIQPQHREVLQSWLANKPGWLPATKNDILVGLDKQSREYMQSEMQALSHHPFYVADDFNRDGNQDFAVVLIKKNGRSKKFAVAIFNGSFIANQKINPTFYTERIESGDLLFWTTGDEFGNRFIVGPPSSDSGYIIKPRGRTYAIE